MSPWDDFSTAKNPEMAPSSTKKVEEIYTDGATKEVSPWDAFSKPRAEKQAEAKPVDNDPWRFREMKTLAKVAGKGIPVIGNLYDEDEHTTKFREENPWSAKGLEVAGGVASMIPAVKGIQGASAAFPLLQKLIPQMAMYGAAGAATGAADAATSEDGDVASAAKWGGVTGMMGPAIGKALSPKALPASTPKMKPTSATMDPAYRRSPVGKEAIADLERIVKEAGQKAKDKVINAEMPAWVKGLDKISQRNSKVSPGTRMLTSGILTGGGLFGGVGMIPAAAIGSLPYTAPMAVKGLRRASQATWANKKIPKTNMTYKDIVKAMALQQAGDTGTGE